MKELIKENLSNAKALEELYQSDKRAFAEAFAQLYPDIADEGPAQVWYHRLNYRKQYSLFNRNLWLELFLVLVICLVGGMLVNLPGIFGGDAMQTYFLPKNIFLIAFVMLVAYEIAGQRLTSMSKIAGVAVVFVVPALFVNLLNFPDNSQTLVLMCLHLPLLLWCVYGYVRSGFRVSGSDKWFAFLKYNGDLVVLGTLLLIAGGVLSGLTIALFRTINLDIEKFFFTHIGPWGLVSAPVITVFILGFFPGITSRIANVIASVFGPLVGIMLIIYLATAPFTGVDIFNNRDNLIVFNLILLGVMAIIVFSVSESGPSSLSKFSRVSLLVLALLTIIVNAVALAAISYRLASYGATPNRIAVIGSNILIFIHLLMITYKLYLLAFSKRQSRQIEKTVVQYIPVYFTWVCIVVFAFPFIFGMF